MKQNSTGKKPLFPKWKSATKNSSQTSQSKEGECDQAEEDEEEDEDERIEGKDLKDDKEQILNEELAEEFDNLLLMQKQLNNARTKGTIWIQRTVQLMKLRMLILMKNHLFLKQTTAWQQMTRYWLTIVQTVLLHYKYPPLCPLPNFTGRFDDELSNEWDACSELL